MLHKSVLSLLLSLSMLGMIPATANASSSDTPWEQSSSSESLTGFQSVSHHGNGGGGGSGSGGGGGFTPSHSAPSSPQPMSRPEPQHQQPQVARPMPQAPQWPQHQQPQVNRPSRQEPQQPQQQPQANRPSRQEPQQTPQWPQHQPQANRPSRQEPQQPQQQPQANRPSRQEPQQPQQQPQTNRPSRQEPQQPQQQPQANRPSRQDSQQPQQQPQANRPSRQEPQTQRPQDSRHQTSGRESKPVILNPPHTQGGIGNMKGQALNNVQPVSGRHNVMIGTNEKSQIVTFKQNNDGTHQILGVQGRTSSGHSFQAKYDETGRKKSMDIKKADGTAVNTYFHKDGTSHSEIKRPDGTRIFTDSKRGGYIQAPPRTIAGRTIVQRTYINKSTTIVNNRVYVRNYYIGRTGHYGYAPSYSFWPGYYVYYHAPWTPFYYPCASWGWYSNPWLFNPYNPYAYYFTPYPTYYGASYWIVDNILADLLAIHYENEEAEQRRAIDAQNAQANAEIAAQSEQIQQQATQIAAQQALINRQEKDLMAAQVTQETNSQQTGVSYPIETALGKGGYQSELQAKQNGAPLSLNDTLAHGGYRFYLGDATIDASYINKSGESVECSLDSGDIIDSYQPVQATLNSATGKMELPLSIDMAVVTSKKGNCPATSIVTVATETLVNLKNDLAAKVNEKEVLLTQQSGKNGIPKLPAGGQVTSNIQVDHQTQTQAEQVLEQQQQDINQIQNEAN